MHPTDAAHRNLSIRSNGRGAIESRINCGAARDIRRNDAWRGKYSAWVGTRSTWNQLEVAQQHAGESINDLTDNLAIDALCGTAAFNGTSVTVAAAGLDRVNDNRSVCDA